MEDCAEEERAANRRTLLAAWNAATYVAQIDDTRLTEAMSQDGYLRATRKVLRDNDGLWFKNECLVVKRLERGPPSSEDHWSRPVYGSMIAAVGTRLTSLFCCGSGRGIVLAVDHSSLTHVNRPPGSLCYRHVSVFPDAFSWADDDEQASVRQ